MPYKSRLPARFMLSSIIKPPPVMNRKSVQEVSKQAALGHSAEKASRGHGFGKTDVRYWRTRLFRSSYKRGDERREVADWCMKLAHAGRRETLNLRTPNQAAAAQKAADIYRQLVGEGWDAVLMQWKPKAVLSAKPATVGEFVAAVTAVSATRPMSLWEYAKCLRRIAADVSGLPRDDARKWDGRSGGAEKWRETVDALSLSILTPESVQAWRLARLREAGENPAVQRATKTTINSVVRKAKSLFAAKGLRYLDGSLVLPPNPFAGVEFFERASMRYESKIDTPALVEAARTELGSDPAKVEAWKAFVLLMFAGLRKNEADKLRWESVDFTAGVLRIEDHEHFHAKGEASKGSIELDKEVVAMMRGWRARDVAGVYVLRSRVAPIANTKFYHYRAIRTFDALAAWLKAKGITAKKALHELRKEAGSMVADKHGIFAASRFLRHADIGITSAHYLDKKQRVTVGLGGLLSAPVTVSNVTAFPVPVKQAKPANTKRKRA